MTGAQYEQAIKALGWSNRGICRKLFLCGERSGRRWLKDGPPHVIAFCLTLMLKDKMAPARALEIKDELVAAPIRKPRRK
jgi:hypothetical protein